MGKFEFAFGGVLLVYEANPDGVGPSVAVCFYSSVDAFLSASFDKQFLAARSLSSFAEGTPNIVNIAGGSLDTSTLTLGLHFLHAERSDQQALGVLRNFENWHATPSYLVNSFLLADGFPGKLGGRMNFTW